MMKHEPHKKLGKSSITPIFLLLLASVIYTVAFFSNEWFIVKPSHYGIWSVTFCDVLTCQTIPTIFNDQPGWYFFVQVFSIISFILTISSFAMQFMTLLIKNLPWTASTISISCHASVSSLFTALIIFFASLVQESQMSFPSISWSASLACISAMLQISALMLILQ